MALLLPGCLFGEPCRYSDPKVGFTDAGLFRDLLKPGPPAGWRRNATMEDARAWFRDTGFRNATLEQAWGTYGLASLLGPPTDLPPAPAILGGDAPVRFAVVGVLDGHDEVGPVAFTTFGEPLVHLVVAGGTPAQRIRPWLEAFLANASAMEPREREGWMEVFLSTYGTETVHMTESGDGCMGTRADCEQAMEGVGPLREVQADRYAKTLVYSLRAGRLWQDLAPPLRDLDASASARVEAGDWTFVFQVHPVRLERGGESLEVRLGDLGTYKGPWEDDDVGAARAMTEFAAAYASLGRPQPADAKYSLTAVCT